MNFVHDKALNLTRSAKDSISNAKRNIQRMGKQINCVKSKISKKIFKNKLLKQNSYQNQMDYPYYQETNYTNSSEPNSASSKVFEFERFKSKFNLSRIEQKLNISGIVNGVKKKVLKLVQLDDCFEEEEFLYGFRSKVTLVEDQPCILGSTCRGSPQDLNSTSESDSNQKRRNEINSSETFYSDDFEFQLNWIRKLKLLNRQDYQDYLDYKDYHDHRDQHDRQSGEDFTSDGPPDCRVTNVQCSTG
jgi:hypothetical protein